MCLRISVKTLLDMKNKFDASNFLKKCIDEDFVIVIILMS